MVNWHDPTLLLEDYYSFVKLNHAIAGLYIWETVFSSNFELDVLRGKRPYRWTIWLYLGTRYAGLLAFFFFFIVIDGPRVPCQPFTVTTFALGYVSWAFASVIIVLRVIAIWNRNTIVSLLAVGVWLGGLALHIQRLTEIEGTFIPAIGVCVTLHVRTSLVSYLGILVVDIVLLLAMLIGLLRHVHKHPNGIWKLLYQQCIIWLVLASIAEIPPVILILLNLNDVWNQMLSVSAFAILSIGAARMYRSLSDRGSFTEYASSDLPQFSLRIPMHFMSVTVTQSETVSTMHEDPVFLPADQIQVGFAPGGSMSSLAYENMTDKASLAGHQTLEPPPT